MMGKTHIAVGIATAFILFRPYTPSELAAATIGGSIGGIMADIDVKIDKSNKYSFKASIDALYGELLAISISLAVFLADCQFGGEIIKRIADNYIFSITGCVFLTGLIIVGEMSKHRDRTHSLLALMLFSIAVVMIDSYIGIAFFLGYASHLFIDLFNKMDIRLLYPLKKGISFKLIYADRIGNEVLLLLGTFCAAAYLYSRIYGLQM